MFIFEPIMGVHISPMPVKNNVFSVRNEGTRIADHCPSGLERPLFSHGFVQKSQVSVIPCRMVPSSPEVQI